MHGRSRGRATANAAIAGSEVAERIEATVRSKAGAATGAAGAPRRRGICRSKAGAGKAAGRGVPRTIVPISAITTPGHLHPNRRLRD
ncbi:MAG: hypothetical protein OXI66_11795 [Boseongicola sp.]|nr:hypothetical protein [Boseongicola sp.]